VIEQTELIGNAVVLVVALIVPDKTSDKIAHSVNAGENG
jgi:hypothetical protein